MDGKPLLEQFSDAMHDVLAQYLNQGLTMAEILGAIEVLKFNFQTANLERGDDEIG